jgi:hypothetical protein
MDIRIGYSQFIVYLYISAIFPVVSKNLLHLSIEGQFPESYL